jgi:predicted GH43/DUF377 family glycosyl hydrolase
MRSLAQTDTQQQQTLGRARRRWRTRGSAALLAVLWLAACAPAAATVVPATATHAPATALPATSAPTALPPASPTGAATATIASTATAITAASPTVPAATATAPVQSLFQLDPDNPVLKADFGWARTYLDPGAVIYHDGQFHMFFNGIESWPAAVGVGYATSPDGQHWTVQGDKPVFSLGPYTQSAAYNGPNLFAQSVLVQPDGTWVLYYYTLEGASFNGDESIGRATAPKPTGPWTADPQPVLKPGTPGTWDAGQVSAPNVLQTADGYVMYYDGLSSHNGSLIGMATSPDGQHWTKYNDPATTTELYAESDPVLQPEPNAWDAKRVMDPNVLPIDGGWAMIYLSADGSGGKFAGSTFAFGYATSPDGRTWTPLPQNPILSTKGHQDWNATYLVTLVQDANQQYLLFDAASAGGTRIFLATHAGALQMVKP